MPDLSIPSNELAELIARVRGLQAREEVTDPDSGSNPADDDMIDTLQDSPGDLSLQEAAAVIRGMNDRQQAELVALFWTGRGDAEAEDWDATIELARERRERPVEQYLLSQPLVADHWSEGLERIGKGIVVDSDPSAAGEAG